METISNLLTSVATIGLFERGIDAVVMLRVFSGVVHPGVRPVMGVADWEAERRLLEVTSRMSPLTWVLLAAAVVATLVFFFRRRR